VQSLYHHTKNILAIAVELGTLFAEKKDGMSVPASRAFSWRAQRGRIKWIIRHGAGAEINNFSIFPLCQKFFLVAQ
jgi:hypothetical protein